MAEFLDTDFAPLDFKPSADERTAQQLTVLEALRKGPCSTTALRNLFVAHPAGRVRELRQQGFQVLTQRAGRFALYVLREAA